MARGVGVLRPGEPVLDLSENVSLLTASDDYAWINTKQNWAIGTANLATGDIHLVGYLQQAARGPSARPALPPDVHSV